MCNRVIRYFEQPHGVYHGSVFCQLSGGVGPCALTCDPRGNLYVAQYETAGERVVVSCTVANSVNEGPVVVVDMVNVGWTTSVGV